jgi:hypothetical protein
MGKDEYIPTPTKSVQLLQITFGIDILEVVLMVQEISLFLSYLSCDVLNVM